MKATDFLKQQHTQVRELFQKLEESDDQAEKVQLFQELASNLVGHDAIERQLFYPACEEAMGMDDELGEALVEHGVVEFGLYQADQALNSKDADEDEFGYKLKVLREVLEHHIKEEEEEYFPKVEEKIDIAALEELTEEMQELFAEQLQTDFRVGLHSNLQQVFAGIVKTSPPEEGAGPVLDPETATRKRPEPASRSKTKAAKRSA